MTLKETLYAWISNTLNIEVIYAYQNATALNHPYATIEINSIKSTGVPDKIFSEMLIDESVDIQYEQLKEAFCVINIYGDDAYNLAIELSNSIYMQSIIDLFVENNIGFIRISDIRNIKEIVRQEYEQRAQFDCFFYIKLNVVENIETIQKIEITNQIDNTTTLIERN